MKFSNKFKHTIPVFLLTVLFIFSACKKEEEVNPPDVNPATGFFIVHEGNFGQSNASIGFYDSEKKEASLNIFKTTNGRGIGDQLQSIAINGDNVYAVVQNSGKIEVFNGKTFKSVAAITEGIASPRYMAIADNDKAYITDNTVFGEATSTTGVAVLDLKTNKVISKITLEGSTNTLLAKGDKVFVTNYTFGTSDNFIKIIDTNTNKVSKTVEVAVNPEYIKELENGNFVVSCSGRQDFSTTPPSVAEKSAIVILSSDGEVKRTITFEKSGLSNLTTNEEKDTFYFKYDGGIYKMGQDDTTAPQTPLTTGLSVYGMSFDTVSDQLIIADAKDYTGNGDIHFFDPKTSKLTQTIEVGIIPNAIVNF